jgi:UDP-N-acetylmuramoyl-tripeptide--D-alanyl-D-alanine ligase
LTLARKTRVVAVVGSFGKSTTMRAVTTALGRRVHPRAVLNFNSSLAWAILRIRPWQRHAVVEVGIGTRGQMAVFARLVRPDITVVTSIGSEHNASLKTLEVTRSEKADMVRILAPSGLAALNGDDPNVLWMRNETRARIVTFGFDPSNDVRGSEWSLDWPAGARLTVHAGGAARTLHTRLIGKHTAYSVLAAVAVSTAEGFSLDEIIPRLESLSPTTGRMEPVRLPNGAIILRDDTKSALETIDAALDTLSEIPARRIVVLGEVSEPPGSQGPIYRRLGKRVAEIADRAIIIGDKSARKPLSSGAKDGGLPREKFFNAGESISKAIEALREDMGPGDVVLIKGRNTQHLERISLALQGRDVRCLIKFCRLKVACAECAMLERGWDIRSAAKKRTESAPQERTAPDCAAVAVTSALCFRGTRDPLRGASCGGPPRSSATSEKREKK